MARAVETSHEIIDPAVVTVVQVAVGESHTLALTGSGSVYTWGRGQFGRQGMGVFQDELEPTLMEIGMSVASDEDVPSATNSDWDSADKFRITQIAAGSYHSLALSVDGTVWSWGFNAYGQLGRQRAASYPAPITFSVASSFSFDENRKNANSEGKPPRLAAVEAGGMMSSAVDKEGGLWLWGAVPQPAADTQTSREADSFELANIERPQRVLALAGQKVRRVSCGSEHILALVDGYSGVQCYGWGGNAFGQLGLGDFAPRDTPTVISALVAQQVGTIVDFACGFFHSAVVSVNDNSDPGDNSNQTGSPLMDQVMDSPKLRGRMMPEQYMESPRVRPKQSYPYSASASNIHGMRSQPRGAYSIGSDASSRAHSVSSVSSWGGLPLRAQVQAKQREAQSVRLSTCWAFGQNENGQLGIGTRTNSHTPAVVDSLPTHELIQTVSCGLFHTAVVTESGDVWVWGMEGGLGQCPGIGPPGSKTGDALTPVRVFGESSAKCNPLSGAKGIACGGAHTVTVANGGMDLWAWGRGKNGVLGLGHHSDSWFPSPVLWPPGIPKDGKEADPEREYEDRKSSRASSRGGSRGRGDEIRPYTGSDELSKPPRSNSLSRSAGEQIYVETAAERPPRGQVASIRKAMEQPARQAGMASPGRQSRRGDQFWPPVQAEPQEISNPRTFRRDMEPPSTVSMRAFMYQMGGAAAAAAAASAPSPQSPHPDDVTALKAELADCRRYAENLHAAVYGGIETFPLPIPVKPNYYTSNGSSSKTAALQEWQQHVEEAPLEELAKLEIFYKGMRNRLKDMLFQRKMEDWCRRAMSGVAASSYQEPPPVREPYSVQSTPYFDGPGEFAMRMSGILSDRGEMLPPAALAASMAEFRMQSQRHRR